MEDEKLSDHFLLSELVFSYEAQRRGLSNDPADEATLDNLKFLATHVLEPIRAKFGPFAPTSGYRSPAVNKAVGGVPRSQHAVGQAADIVHPATGRLELYHWIRDNLEEANGGIGFDQLILEFYHGPGTGWVHVSIRSDGNNRQQVISIG
jgi:zinc D-Ala-D-Ala carboxypeptidase